MGELGTTTAGAGRGARARRTHRAVLLAALATAYLFNIVDRQILSILAPLIQRDLRIDDLQLGLLQGLPFAALYAVLALPAAWAADRWSRGRIVAGALALWSVCTALCSQAAGFGSLLLGRIGVSAGEAGGVAPAYSVIADVFPARARARALALYSFASPVGMALATIGGGLIAHALGWRAAFLIFGLSGLAFAPVLRLVVPERAAPDRRPAARAKAAGGLGALARRPSFWLLSLGAAAASAATYGMNAWLPSFFVRSFHMPLAHAGAYFGGFALIGGVAGLWLGGWLSDRLGRANRAAYALVPAAAFLLLAPIGLAATLATSAAVGFVLFAIAAGLANLSLGPVAAAVQSVAPAPLRATASATYLALLTLLGMAGGPIFVGAASKALHAQFGAESLAQAVRLELVFYLLAAALLAAAARGVARDWTD